MNDDITIVIPFYSALRFLRPAIDSVLAQDDAHWQLLVLDDASPETRVKDIVESYCDSRIRYVRNPQNFGMAKNWNTGFDLATTPLVSLLHADDALGPGYVRSMRAALAQHPDASMAYCLSTVIDSDGRAIRSAKEFIKSLLRPHSSGTVIIGGRRAFTRIAWANFIMCGTLCYRRERFASLRFDESNRTLPDFDLVIRALLRGDHLIGLPLYEHFYRRHEIDSATAKYLGDMARFLEDAALLDLMAVQANTRGWHAAEIISRLRPILLMHLAYCVLGDLAKRRPRSAATKVRFLMRELARFNRPSEKVHR